MRAVFRLPIQGAFVQSSRRFYCAKHTHKTLQEIDVTKMITKPALFGKPIPKNEDLVFGGYFTDHMLTVEWESEIGWLPPVLHPYGPLNMDPSVSSLHYALQGFEGMKAYKDKSGKVRLFRPELNMARMNRTASRLSLPSFNGDQLLACIKELLRTDQRWVPSSRGFSLYIRPTIIATHNVLGVLPPKRAMIFVILSPVGPYFKTGFRAVRLNADPTYVRSWPGGTGDIKCGGNYAGTIAPQRESESKGFNQILWLFGPEHYVTEVGTMNQFFYWTNDHGEKELVTPPLDGTILPGVTRDSVLHLARSWGEFKVSERKITIHQVIEAIKQGRMIEAFGSGTAAIVSPVRCIHYEGNDYNIPLDPSKPHLEIGPLAQRIATALTDIQYGDVPHPWSVVVN
eukprot:c21219_g1_i1.p1 GENE.c21219_g1_i1~~c21219_g1_i1.p1  ORF type:complete len:399 (+),score=145.71 c21219_g1_i1:1862-3058(+)